MTAPGIAASPAGTSYETFAGTLDSQRGPGPASSISLLPLAETTPANVVILVAVYAAVTGAGTIPAVTGITGGGLTFHRYIGPLQDSSTPGDPSGTGAIGAELWWTYSAAPLAPTTFAVAFSPALSWASNKGVVFCFGYVISGCVTPSAPWDAAIGLPATATGAGPLTVACTLTNGAAVSFSDGVFAGGHVVNGVGALVGTDGDALAVALDGIGGFDFDQNGAAYVPWSGTAGAGFSGTGGVPDLSGAIPYLAVSPETPPPPPLDGIYPDPPMVFLSWSDDRGHSFSNPLGQSMGAAGAYLTQAQWQRLGMGRDRVFRLEWSSPVRTALMGAWVTAAAGQS